VMLPLSTVDHLAEQRRHLQSRLHAFESVTAPSRCACMIRVGTTSLRHELATLPAQAP
jgi:hypothetical protein